MPPVHDDDRDLGRGLLLDVVGAGQQHDGSWRELPDVFLEAVKHAGAWPRRRSGPAEFQSRQRPRARAELVSLDAEALEHVHVEIAQGRRVLRIEVAVLAVLEAAAGEVMVFRERRAALTTWLSRT